MDDMQGASFWCSVQCMVDGLGPAKSLTEALGGDQYTTMSGTCFAIAEITKKLNAMKKNKVAEKLAEAVRERFKPWFQQHQQLSLIRSSPI